MNKSCSSKKTFFYIFLQLMVCIANCNLVKNALKELNPNAVLASKKPEDVVENKLDEYKTNEQKQNRQNVCQKINFLEAFTIMLQRDTSKCMHPNIIVQETLKLPQINYASKNCLAKVLYANSEAVNINAVLDDRDNDSYLRNPCEKAQDKFLIIRMCDRIKPTLLEIANFEFFSSGPKNIRLSASKTYPAADWLVVGEFEAQNTREIQQFPILTEIDFYFKFVKLEILTYYGNEYYCTLSFVRIYGVADLTSIYENFNNNFVEENATFSDEKSVTPQKQKILNNSATQSNTAAIFMEFGKRLTALETNFKHYNQVVQSIRHLRNETRFLNQEVSVLRRNLFVLQRDRDMLKELINNARIESRLIKQELQVLEKENKILLNRNSSK